MKANTILYCLRSDTNCIFPVEYREGTFYYAPAHIHDLAGREVSEITADDVHPSELAARKALVGKLTIELDKAKRGLAYARTRKKELRVKPPVAVDVDLPLTDLEPQPPAVVESKRRGRKEGE